MNAAERFHERGFSRSVFADDRHDFGLASAVAVLLFVVIVAVTLGLRFLVRERA